MKKFNIKCPSEKKMREVEIRCLNGNNVTSENVPFVSMTKEKKIIVKAAPMAYVPELKSFILKHIDYLAE